MKLDKYANILNCTDETLKITDLIKFLINPFPKETVKIIALNKETATEQTAELLEKIYNGSTPLKTIESQNLRDKLCLEMNEFTKLLFDYFYDDSLNSEDKMALKRRIQQKLSPQTAFTAFKIWTIKNNDTLTNEFKDILP